MCVYCVYIHTSEESGVSQTVYVCDLEGHDLVYSFEDDCFATLSEHGDAANAACGLLCVRSEESDSAIIY